MAAGTDANRGNGNETHTEGGSVIDGSVTTGRDFVGRDQNISITNIYHAAANYISGAWHQLPTPPEHFVGRGEALAFLREALISPKAVVGISSVQGMAGIGKTALATMAAHALCERYPDAQLWIPLHTHSLAPRSVEQARDGVLHALYPAAKLPDDEAALWAMYRNSLQGKRALVVLDDVYDDAQIAPLLPPAGCVTIVTSRHSLSSGQALPLDTLPRAESRALLREVCPRITASEADALAEACGDWPIALRVAAAFLKTRRAKPVAEYLAELQRNPYARLDAAEEVLIYSHNALHPTEQAAFAALSIMPADFDRAAAVAVGRPTTDDGRPTTGDTSAMLDTLDTLVAYHLILFDDETQRYGWHDLVKRFAGERLVEPARAEALRRHAAHFTAVAWEAHQLYERGGEHVAAGLALFDRERVHIEAAFKNLEGLRDRRGLVALVNAVVYTGQALRFHPRQRIAWLNAQAEAARASGDKSNEGAALGSLGLAYADLGEVRRAIEYHEQYLAIAREIGDRRGEGNALGNLGIAYADLGEVRRAIEYYEQRIVIALEIGDRRGEGNALGNLGNAYADWGEVRRAIEYYEQHLAIAREIGDRRGEGIALGNLGIVYWSLGELQRAIEYYEQYLAIAREIGDRRGEGIALGNLGGAFADMKDEAKAIDYYQQAIEIHRTIGNKEGQARDGWNLGLRYESQGELARAITLMQVRVDYLRELGHPDAEKRAAHVDGLRRRLAEGDGANGVSGKQSA